MFAFDDRTGNVITTVAAFLAAAGILYFARGTFLILLVALLLSYVLEPVVSWVERHQPFGRASRSWAIAEVFLVGTALIGGVVYKAGPGMVAQLRNFYAATVELLKGLSTGQMPSAPAALALSVTQQHQINSWLARHHDQIIQLFERGAASAASVAETALWFLVAPILAIFILRDGRSMFESLRTSAQQKPAVRVLLGVDAMLARYVRSQLALSALSFLFYIVSMLLLGYPYALALALLGGVLEILPALGWIITAGVILLTGFLMHAHWVWMAFLLGLWRLVQDYVNSPRIMGTNLNLNPFIVIIALMIGGEVGGVVGAYLAVPVAAALRIVWMETRGRKEIPNEAEAG
jgi:predicted PurR-regulated permease PerM